MSLLALQPGPSTYQLELAVFCKQLVGCAVFLSGWEDGGGGGRIRCRRGGMGGAGCCLGDFDFGGGKMGVWRVKVWGVSLVPASTSSSIRSEKTKWGEAGERVEEGDKDGVWGVAGGGSSEAGGKGDGDSSFRLRCLSSGGSGGSSTLTCCAISSSCFGTSCLLSLAEGTDG